MRTRGSAWMASSVFWSLVFTAMLAAFGTANAIVPANVVCGYDNDEPQIAAQGNYTDIRRGAQINMVDTLADPCTLNFTGSTGSAGDVWLTMNGVPGGALPTSECWNIEATVLIKRFDNRKAIGFVTNYDEATKTGLFFGVYDNGNTDALTLSTFDGATGQLKTQLATKSLGSKIKENTWYGLDVDTCETDSGFNAEFSVAIDGVGADCEIAEQCLAFGGPLPAGIVAVGAAGIAGQAKSAFVDSQVRNIVFGTSDSN